jgi:HD superfamily phosphohydrolase
LVLADENPIRPVWPDYPRTGWGLYFDPLYGYTPLPPLIRQALDLETFQRLRRIRQLSTIELAFPGATHNRFEHSVGVYNLATTAFDALVNRRETENLQDWPHLLEAHKIALQLASLFHDIGHGPHGHVFEMYCERNPDFRPWHHENVTRDLIVSGKARYRDIPLFLQRLHENFRARGVAGHEFLTPDNIAAIALGQPPPANKEYLFLSQIVHSECDVDRMDYLRRDALHIGFGAGGIDVWEIIHNFTLVWDPGTGTFNLRLLSSAAEALESLLAVRDLMYRRVYYNETHRAAQELLIRAVHDISKTFDREELCLLTDDELFEVLESSEYRTAFTKEVIQTIRARRMYHSIPGRLTVDSDLDVESQRMWSEYATGLSGTFEKLMLAEQELSGVLKLPTKYRVVFDVTVIPISKPDAYDVRYFWDPESKNTKSLKELLPHLEFTHGTVTIDHTSLDLYEKYRRMVSKLYIFIPFEYWRECTDSVYKQLEGSAKDLFRRKVTAEEYRTALDCVVNGNLAAVVDKFVSGVFNLHSPQKDILRTKLTKSALNYTDLIFRQRYPEIEVLPS